ncbi:MAG: hypothetical protein MOIL_01675 [Candidatus Methanolliviera sp. GoM_oil]|nr:MAG: hypothetical protein MOIL_01675 [Candidatus Methanolliviera sp. GoM_oil]
MKELFIASIAFALFILCPRMAGMTNVNYPMLKSSKIFDFWDMQISDLQLHCGFLIHRVGFYSPQA